MREEVKKALVKTQNYITKQKFRKRKTRYLVNVYFFQGYREDRFTAIAKTFQAVYLQIFSESAGRLTNVLDLQSVWRAFSSV